ncbi:MAG: helix-turn-helix domain-containing protein [Rickettsiales bacterium]|nr:helix-turn-helix domain-containing protein [Rickettsiales bacterium]
MNTSEAQETENEPSDNEADHYQHVGAYLRDLRQKFELSVEEVASRLHIRPKYIIALEEGNMEDMPGKVYTIGYLQNYAEFLGLDPEDVLKKYVGLSALDAQQTFKIVRPNDQQDNPSYRLVGGLVALLILGVLIWQFTERTSTTPDIRVDEVPPSIAEKLDAKLVLTPQNKACLDLKQHRAYPPCYPNELKTIITPFSARPVRNIMELKAQ